MSAEQSKTSRDIYAAHFAIDLRHYTHSWATAGADDEVWLKVKFDKVNCIKKVIIYLSSNPDHTWTCTSSDCLTCQANSDQNYCDDYVLTVNSERSSTDGQPVPSDCRYGDTVKLQNTGSISSLKVYEIATIVKGEIT